MLFVGGGCKGQELLEDIHAMATYHQPVSKRLRRPCVSLSYAEHLHSWVAARSVLSAEERALIWRFRSSLTADPRALTKVPPSSP